MITYQEGPQLIRVERVERHMWVTNITLVFLAFFLAIYFKSGASSDPLAYLLVPGGLVTFSVVLLITSVRQRPVCVIEPGRVGYGFMKGKMWWLDRDKIGLVVIHRIGLLDVQILDRNGKLLATPTFTFFDPKELRKAFELAGIPLR